MIHQEEYRNQAINSNGKEKIEQTSENKGLQKYLDRNRSLNFQPFSFLIRLQCHKLQEMLLNQNQ